MDSSKSEDFELYVDCVRRYYHRQLLKPLYILADDYGLSFSQIASICRVNESSLRRIMDLKFKVSVVCLMYLSHLIVEYWCNNKKPESYGASQQ